MFIILMKLFVLFYVVCVGRGVYSAYHALNGDRLAAFFEWALFIPSAIGLGLSILPVLWLALDWVFNTPWV